MRIAAVSYTHLKTVGEFRLNNYRYSDYYNKYNRRVCFNVVIRKNKKRLFTDKFFRICQLCQFYISQSPIFGPSKAIMLTKNRFSS